MPEEATTETEGTKMSWELLVILIIKEGVPLAISLAKKWGTKTAPTDADYDEILSISRQTAEDRMKAQLVSLGVSLDSDKAKEILAQVRG